MISQIGKKEEGMIRGMLTPRETEIIHQLIEEKGITVYEVAHTVLEGNELPGNTFPHEIDELSGAVVTVDAVYHFWLKWKDDQYFFWAWDEGHPEELRRISAYAEAQKRLRQRPCSS
jgi:hypothetical protein